MRKIEQIDSLPSAIHYLEGRGNIAVHAMTPELLTQETLARMEVPSLINRGFEYDLSESQALERAEDNFSLENSLSYFALRGGKARASVTFTSLLPDDENAKRFWKSIKNDKPNFLSGAQALFHVTHLTAAEINNSITDPNWRRMGLQKELMNQFMRESFPPPHILKGETRSPAEAALLADFFNRYNYRTFLGNIEITPGAEFYDRVPLLLSRANAAFFGFDGAFLQLLSSSDDPTLPDIPVLEGFSNQMWSAFQPINRNQPYYHEALYLPFLIARRELVSLAQR